MSPTTKQNESDFRNTIDWRQLHKDTLSYDAGTVLAVCADGTWYPVFSGTSLRGQEYVVLHQCPGLGNIDITPYCDGWATRQDDGTYLTVDGRVLDEDGMISECINEGDWDDLYNSWAEDFAEQAQERAEDFAEQAQERENEEMDA